MKQSKRIANIGDRAAIRQALAILEDEEVDTIDDNTIEIPVDFDSCCSYDGSSNDSYREMIQRHALSPSRSKATRRASVTLFNSKQLQQISSTISEPSDADIDSCSSYDGSSNDSYREVIGKVQRKSHTKRRSRSRNHATMSKKEEDNNTHRNSSSVNVKLSVRFAVYDQINYVPHINDISQEEIESRWMKEEDYNSIRERSLRLVEMIEDPHKRYPISADTMIVNKHLICIRGLSEMTTQCVYERGRVQRQLETAIFRMQQQQKEDFGVVDPQAIRQASRNFSHQSYKVARFVGISDGVTMNAS